MICHYMQLADLISGIDHLSDADRDQIHLDVSVIDT